jgi:hypothetical protein
MYIPQLEIRNTQKAEKILFLEDIWFPALEQTAEHPAIYGTCLL